jgi:hypothetical protein
MFSRHVKPYLGLVFWQDDKSTVELLEKALSKQPKEEPDRRDGVDQTRILLDYLKADDVEKRAQHARKFARREHVAYAWLKDVAKRLEEEGADANRCRALLKPRIKRSRGSVMRWEEPLFRSGEGEPW